MKTIGNRKDMPIEAVAPNGWNPNQMPPHKFASLKRDLESVGWVKSQPLLVWGSDKRGSKKNIIIDGEHRWRAARELGIEMAPMVILEGITKTQAIELTIKLDNNRGEFDKEKLSDVIREIVPNLEGNIVARIGFTTAELTKLNEPVVNLEDNAPLVSKNEASKMIPLYFTNEQHTRFITAVKSLSKAHGAETVTDVVVHCVNERHAAVNE